MRPVPVGQAGIGAVERAPPFHDLLRQANDTRLGGQRVPDRPPDPEARVDVERGTARRVELVDRVEQAERSFLHEVVDGEPEVPVTAGDRAHLVEMTNDEPLAR